uniref:peroxidase n=1 Tax=Medicago truncatula TaxID=3880 RepID=I3T9B7_MEDTR|nr:unknown [Medicago truncatula]
MNSLRAVAIALCCIVVVLGGLPFSSNAQLDPSFYRNTCPNVSSIVREVIRSVSKKVPRMLGSLVRFHFHDCFVQGCDASVLLNKTDTVVSEQDAFPNRNSLRGLDVVNQIKTAVEKACPNTVSCADILALSAELSSTLADGPDWKVPLGRRDGLTANQLLANKNLPAPFNTTDQLKAAFAAQGLDTTDLVALSGAHTFWKSSLLFYLLADCTTSTVQEVRIQLLTQLTYNNCAQYVPMVDLARTLPISIQRLLINLTRTITLIFK